MGRGARGRGGFRGQSIPGIGRSDVDTDISHIIKVDKRFDPNGWDGQGIPYDDGDYLEERSGYRTTERPNTLRDLNPLENLYQGFFDSWARTLSGDRFGANWGEILPEDVEEFEDVGEFGKLCSKFSTF